MIWPFLRPKNLYQLYFEVIKERPEPDEDLFILGYPQRRFELIEKTGDLIHYENYDSFPVDHHDDFGGLSGGPVFNRAIDVVGVFHSFKTGGNSVDLVRGSQLKELMEGEIGLECGELTVLRECIKRELDSLTMTAEQGNAYAQYILAVIYQNNLAVIQNGVDIGRELELAFNLFHKAAEQGLADAQYDLARMYYTGVKEENGEEWVVEKDLEEARKWYQKAAAQGYGVAQHNLAGMYLRGEGVEEHIEPFQDLLAYYWYHKAAEQGYAYDSIYFG